MNNKRKIGLGILIPCMVFVAFMAVSAAPSIELPSVPLTPEERQEQKESKPVVEEEKEYTPGSMDRLHAAFNGKPIPDSGEHKIVVIGFHL